MHSVGERGRGWPGKQHRGKPDLGQASKSPQVEGRVGGGCVGAMPTHVKKLVCLGN